MTVSGKIYLKDNSGNINEFTVQGNDANAVHKTGDESVAGTKTFTSNQIISKNTPALILQMNNVDTTVTSTTSQILSAIAFNDKNDTDAKHRTAAIRSGLGNSDYSFLQLCAYNPDPSSNAEGHITVCYPRNGTAYATAPTPGNTDNSTKIATTAYVRTANPIGTTYVSAATVGQGVLNLTHTAFGTVFNSPTKNYRVGLATWPANNDNVILYSVSNANITSGTNTVNKSMTWNADTGILTTVGFSGQLTGNVTGNCSGTSSNVTGIVAMANGGTGRNSYANSNGVITVDNTNNQFTAVATANGALYATAANGVSKFGTLPIAQGGTGATTRLNAIKALTNENVSTNATHFLGLKSDWSKVGYFTLAECKSLLGLGSAAYTASTAYATSGHTHSYLPLSGGTMTGKISFAHDINPLIECTWTDVDIAATSRSATVNKIIGVILDKNGLRFGGIECSQNTSALRDMHYTMRSRDNTYWISDFTLREDNAGNVSVVLSNPAYANNKPSNDDNSTRIPTTSWVRTATGNFACNAATATKLGSSTVGGVAKPIYLNAGTATAISATVGSASKPVYLNGGTITACTTTFSASNHTHSYIPTSGGSLSGVIESTGANTGFKVTNGTTKQCSLLRGSTYVGLYDPVNSQWVTRVAESKAYIHYGTTSAVSDKRNKKNITNISDNILNAWGEVEWKQFNFKDIVNDKTNIGLIAQDVEEIFNNNNLNAEDYPFFEHEIWNKDEEHESSGDQYYIHYTEALCVEAAYQRRRAERAEARISELETEVNLLKEQMISILEKLS